MDIDFPGINREPSQREADDWPPEVWRRPVPGVGLFPLNMASIHVPSLWGAEEELLVKLNPFLVGVWYRISPLGVAG
jgi:hypothetical protein